MIYIFSLFFFLQMDLSTPWWSEEASATETKEKMKFARRYERMNKLIVSILNTNVSIENVSLCYFVVCQRRIKHMFLVCVCCRE